MKPYNDLAPPRLLRPTSLNQLRLVAAPDSSIETRRSTGILGRGHSRQLSGIREASGGLTTRADKPKPLFQDSSTETKSTPLHQSADSARANNHDGAPPVPLHAHGSTSSLPHNGFPERRSSRMLHRRMSENFMSSEDCPVPPPHKSSTRKHALSSPPMNANVQNDKPAIDGSLRLPSRTFVRTEKPVDILEHSSASHSRLEMEVGVAASLFVGGGTVAGHVRLTSDTSMTAVRKKIVRVMIARISVDIVGVEEMSDGRHWIFLSLANELIDEDHPPPIALITTPTIVSQADPFWIMKSGTAEIPFCLNLPLNVGPPPYNSKSARIRYILCSTALIKVNGYQHIVRRSRDITVLTVFDPEKALASLPSPLIASDVMLLPGMPNHSVKLNAGLHRQTWVDGAKIFVDIHVANLSSKVLKRLELQLEKITLFFAHPAAGTLEKSVRHLRLPSRCESEIISRMVLKKDKAWKGIQPNGSEVRTCELEAPRGHVTVNTGRYFEVRYFVNISVAVSMFKALQVQLPVTLIHMNSLDIVPNSVSQVTAAIAEKRSRSISHHVPIEPQSTFLPGQAFVASRRQSPCNDGESLNRDQIDDLTKTLDQSPRKMRGVNGTGRNPLSGRVSTAALPMEDKKESHQDRIRGHRRHPSSASSIPRLPRIQISTSGLGFSESEFEITPEPPRRAFYVLPSTTGLQMQKRSGITEKERRNIRIQKELSGARRRSRDGQVNCSWKNVAFDRTDRMVLPRSNKHKGKARAVWVDQ